MPVIVKDSKSSKRPVTNMMTLLTVQNSMSSLTGRLAIVVMKGNVTVV